MLSRIELKLLREQRDLLAEILELERALAQVRRQAKEEK